MLLLILVLVSAGCGGSGDPVRDFRNGDFERAFDAFSARAADGDLEALNFLGMHYYLGAAVERDFAKAAEYFRMAALGNNANAQRNLGILYMRGLGVTLDNHEAYGWFFQAYSGGNNGAQYYLRNLSDNVTPNAGLKAREAIAERVRLHAQNSNKDETR